MGMVVMKNLLFFSTDHMITFGNGEIDNEFEHDIQKYKELGLTKKVVAMLSGSTLLFEELLKGTKNLDEFDEIRNKIYENFRERKKFEITKYLLEPFSLNEKDLKDFLSRPTDNQVTRNILEQILKHRLNTSILLIGFRDKKAQIYEINEFNNISVIDLHFHTIGSGSLNASNSLFIQKHCKENNIKKTIYNVYKSKRNAEVSRGVGKETEILICSGNKIIKMDTNDLEKLDKVYEKELHFGQNEILKENLNSLNSLIKCEVKIDV
jgi:hypothetical protein